jgi:hypothetical protein
VPALGQGTRTRAANLTITTSTKGDDAIVTTAVSLHTADLPGRYVPVRPDGLLSRVSRRCPDHGAESPCVARCRDEDCLVFWCEPGAHHFTGRPPHPA